MEQALLDRFMSKVVWNGDEDECWEWQGAKSRGHGRYRPPGHTRSSDSPHMAHRVGYELLVGPIPEGLQLDHLCRNRACVNPAHLEPVTCRENILRGQSAQAVNARKTHCKRGHVLSGDNLYINPSGERNCRTCGRVRAREWYRKNRAKGAVANV